VCAHCAHSSTRANLADKRATADRTKTVQITKLTKLDQIFLVVFVVFGIFVHARVRRGWVMFNSLLPHKLLEDVVLTSRQRVHYGRDAALDTRRQDCERFLAV
jgi:hypothetical protein